MSARHLLLLVPLLSYAGPSHALLVRFAYSLEVTEVGAESTAPELLAVGDLVTGTFVVDTQVPPDFWLRPNVGITWNTYHFDIDATVEAPGFVFEESPTGHRYELEIFDGHECPVAGVDCFPERSAPTDEFHFGIDADLRDVATGARIDLGFSVTQTNADLDLIASLDVPVAAPDLMRATEKRGRILITVVGSLDPIFWEGAAELASLSAEVVPEPAASWLLGAGLALFASGGRRLR